MIDDACANCQNMIIKRGDISKASYNILTSCQNKRYALKLRRIFCFQIAKSFFGLEIQLKELMLNYLEFFLNKIEQQKYKIGKENSHNLCAVYIINEATLPTHYEN